MKILETYHKKRILKSKREIQKERTELEEKGLDTSLVGRFKFVETKEPIYIVEMSAKEFQLISFYLELEHRKPIINVKVDAKLKENKDEKEN